MSAGKMLQKSPHLEIIPGMPPEPSRVYLNGDEVAMTARRLGELAQTSKPPHMLPLPAGASDAVLYEQHIGIGGERYEAPESVFPPFSYETEAAMRDAGAARWRMDLTIYADGDLPSGELNRSKGHINNESVEVFQVLSGAVRMYMQHPQNELQTYFTDMEAGDLRLIPPGWWHTTHVLSGPSAVMNIVNREGFLDWRDKRYGHQFAGAKGAAYTFARRDGIIVPVPNEEYDPVPELVAVAPTRMPVLGDYENLLQNFCWLAPHALLEGFALEVLSANPASKHILPQQDSEGRPIEDFYTPVYENPQDLPTYAELAALGIEPPLAGEPPITYREVVARLEANDALIGSNEDFEADNFKEAVLRSIENRQQAR